MQLAKLAPSREHSKVEFVSDEEKLNEADVLLTVPEGPEPMVVSGGVVSGGGVVFIVQVRLAGVPSKFSGAS